MGAINELLRELYKVNSVNVSAGHSVAISRWLADGELPLDEPHLNQTELSSAAKCLPMPTTKVAAFCVN